MEDKITTRELVIMGVLTAIVFVAQVAMGFLPNIELVTLLFIVYTLIFGKKVFLMIYAFVFLEGIVYGFGLWWVNYMYVWSMQAIITLLFRKQTSVVFWSILSGIYGLTFGALCAIPYFFMGGASAAFAYWVSGVAYDIPHCIGNVVLCLVMYKPLLYVLRQAMKINMSSARKITSS